MPQCPTLPTRTPELEMQLRALDPADELSYRWAYRETSPHCRRDSDWQTRIVELQGMLDTDGHARAFTRRPSCAGRSRASPNRLLMGSGTENQSGTVERRWVVAVGVEDGGGDQTD
jgi:hypothetical protein